MTLGTRQRFLLWRLLLFNFIGSLWPKGQKNRINGIKIGGKGLKLSLFTENDS